MEKDTSITSALSALQARLGEALRPSDRWDADLMAIGVCTPARPTRLVYFSTFQRAPGRYHVDLEFPAPAGSDLPYVQGEAYDDVDFETLVSIVARHLDLGHR